MRFKFILFTVFSLSSLVLIGQDARYSQFYASPSNLNPTMVGVMPGTLRVSGIYRSQFGAVSSNPYSTYAAAVETRLLGAKSDQIGLGLQVQNDIQGYAQLGLLQINASANYQKMLGTPRFSARSGSSFLVAGVQLGYGQRSINWNRFSTSAQFNTTAGTYDPTTSTGEALSASPRSFMDFGAGLMFYSVRGKRNSYYLGASAYHLNGPNIGINGTTDKLMARYNVHGGAEFLLGGVNSRSPFSFLPSGLVMIQGPSLETTLNTAFKYKRNAQSEIAFRFGVAVRGVSNVSSSWGLESFVGLVGLEVGRTQFNFSYDANISSLSPVTNGRGAFEASIIYTNAGNRKRYDGCPTF
jgi:type IX secretion system PorP/SprF family membrane protein